MPEIKTTFLLRGKLTISNDSYVLKRDQRRGELDLARIARTADREANWIFYADTNMWLYWNNPTKFERRPNGGFTTSVQSYPFFESSIGKTPVAYHIHPDYAVKLASEDKIFTQVSPRRGRDFLHVYVALPSGADIEALSTVGRQYEHRIVTSRGTTILKAGPETPTDSKEFVNLMRDRISKTSLYRCGFYTAMVEIANYVNSELGGYITMNFQPHSRRNRIISRLGRFAHRN